MIKKVGRAGRVEALFIVANEDTLSSVASVVRNPTVPFLLEIIHYNSSILNAFKKHVGSFNNCREISNSGVERNIY